MAFSFLVHYKFQRIDCVSGFDLGSVFSVLIVNC